jgi:hypothetical protein
MKEMIEDGKRKKQGRKLGRGGVDEDALPSTPKSIPQLPRQHVSLELTQ